MSSENHGNLAASYRPHRFADVVGHRHVVTLLEQAIKASRLPQQLLFSGPSGLGKTTLARICAAALLCERSDTGDACGACESCVAIWSSGSVHPDVVEFDAASHGNKEQVKELAQRASTVPSLGSKRIYIIDEAHGLSAAGGQAFLKLLEEPPPHVVFMLCTTDPDKMLRTNRGRCVEFTLNHPTTEELSEHLNRIAASEGLPLPEGLALQLVMSTDPALGIRGQVNALQRALALLRSGAEPELVSRTLGVVPSDLAEELATSVKAGDAAGAVLTAQEIREKSSEQGVRQALLSWTKAAFSSSLESGQLNRRYHHILKMVIECPPGALRTDLLVAEMALAFAPAAPQSEPPPAAPSASETRRVSDAPVKPVGETFLERVAAISNAAAAPLRSLSVQESDGDVTVDTSRLPQRVIDKHVACWQEAAGKQLNLIASAD